MSLKVQSFASLLASMRRAARSETLLASLATLSYSRRWRNHKSKLKETVSGIVSFFPSIHSCTLSVVFAASLYF